MAENSKEDLFVIPLPGGRAARVPVSILEQYIDPTAKVCHGASDGVSDDVLPHSMSIDPATGSSVWHTEWELGQCDYTDEAGMPQSAYVWHRHPLGNEYTEIYQEMRSANWVLGGSVALAIAGGACVKKGYPLGKDGSVDIRIDVQEKLFAADLLDGQGKPIGPRQQPFATGVLLYMSDNGESAYGAYVDVRVDPAEALAIAPASESDDSCELVDGSFRCTATTEGFARFKLTSENDWSGDARIIVSWSGSNGSNNQKTITILPAGLPPNATNFGLVVNGITGDPVTDRIRPTFETLKCTVGPAEDDPLPKWREGAIRGRPAFVRATAPASAPGVVEHAPVIVESLNSEGELSLVPDCSERESRLRVLLGATGQSDPFYLCFSDNGGTIPFSFSSGQLSLNKVDNGQPLDSLDITVDPEPRLVRVVAKNPVVTVGDEVDFELTAYNSDLVKIAMTLFAQPGDPTILQLTSDATLTTTPGSETQGGEQNTNLEATVRTLATKEGSTELQVTPNLLSSPLCKSNKVTVQPLPPL